MTPAARPYADALFGLLQERGATAAVLAELTVVEAALEQVPQAGDLLMHRGAAPAEAAALLDSLTVGRSPLAASLLRLLFRKGRLGILGDIVAALQSRLDAAEGRQRVRAEVARALPAEQLGALRQALARRLGGAVELRCEQRPELIGGVRAFFGDRVLDGSVAGQLEGLGRRLAAGWE